MCVLEEPFGVRFILVCVDVRKRKTDKCARFVKKNTDVNTSMTMADRARANISRVPSGVNHMRVVDVVIQKAKMRRCANYV
jgi:hypothetical protein